MDKAFRFDTIAQFHKFCNLPKPENPLISLIDYSKVKYPVNEKELKWIQNFYSIGLKRDVAAKFNYGQQQFDFDSGVLTFVAPLQFLKVEMNPDANAEPSGWLLLIHPDFLWNTELVKNIRLYDYFNYDVTEALFLSEKEETLLVDIFQSIEKEYQSNIDKFSRQLIITQIERLFIYSERFYERQFLTRNRSSHEMIERFEKILNNYFVENISGERGIPTVIELADQLNISPNYLGSLLRIHTQQSTQQHIQNKIIHIAKEKLSTTNLTISEIAYLLGFEHSQSFSKMFKTKTNQSPLAFRAAFN